MKLTDILTLEKSVELEDGRVLPAFLAFRTRMGKSGVRVLRQEYIPAGWDSQWKPSEQEVKDDPEHLPYMLVLFNDEGSEGSLMNLISFDFPNFVPTIQSRETFYEMPEEERRTFLTHRALLAWNLGLHASQAVGSPSHTSFLLL